MILGRRVIGGLFWCHHEHPREEWVTATHYNTLQHTTTHCNTLQHPKSYDKITGLLCCSDPFIPGCSWWPNYRGLLMSLWRSGEWMGHCNTLQHTATHYNTLLGRRLFGLLQHTIATHDCNTLLQHTTATHCFAGDSSVKHTRHHQCLRRLWVPILIFFCYFWFMIFGRRFSGQTNKLSFMCHRLLWETKNGITNVPTDRSWFCFLYGFWQMCYLEAALKSIWGSFFFFNDSWQATLRANMHVVINVRGCSGVCLSVDPHFARDAAAARMLQCVAVCCSVLQCVAVCCSVL